VLHEVGHSLGFIHEYYRNDGVGIECNYNGQDLNLENASGIKITPDYDPLSIMNESYCRPNFSGLSPRDVVGLQSVYGRPWAKSMVNSTSGECLAHITDTQQYGRNLPLTTQGCGGSAPQKWQYGEGTNSSRYRILNAGLGQTNKLRDDYSNWEVSMAVTAESYLSEEEWSFTDRRIMGLGNVCLAVSEAPVDGENVTVAKCAGSALGQRWDVTYTTRLGYYAIRNLTAPSLCVHASAVDGTGQMKLGSCTSSVAHRREFRLGYGTGALMIAKGDTSNDHVCMEVKDAKPDYGQAAVAKACTSAAAQQWILSGEIKNRSTGQCLTQTVQTGTSGNVRMEPCDQDFQTWDYYP
jgi:hypothetical protein